MLRAAFLPAGWDPALPTIGQLFARGWTASTASRLRRLTMLPVFLQLCLCVIALIFPAEANAAVGPQSPLLHVLGVTDSYGVPLSRYTISTNYGSIFDGGTRAVLATMLEAEAGLCVTIGGVAIWFLMYVISFGFLPDLVEPVAAVAQGYAAQIVPGVAGIAAVIAATFVAVNILRDNLPRAASQAAAAVLIALIGGALVYSPVTWVISGNGPLAQGRDVAVSLGSNSVAGATNTKDTLNRLEGTLATSFVRRPLQTWNFAGQPDSTPSCATAWSKGVNSGDADQIKDGIRDCGAPDSAVMKASADNPSPGQLGTGVLMLMFIGIFALFCTVLGFHIIAEFFRAVGNAIKLLWGFAVGVIPGGPQASLVNTFVAVLFSFVAMFAYITLTIFIGEIVTVVFRQQGNGVVAMLSVLVLMVVAIRWIFKLSKHLKDSSANVAAGVLNSVGASPAPAPTTNILHEKAGGFLRQSGAVALGVGATVAGGALAARSPSASHALHVVAPFIRGGRSSVLRNMDRGAWLHEMEKANKARGNDNGADPDDNTPPQDPPPGGPPPGGGPSGDWPPAPAPQPGGGPSPAGTALGHAAPPATQVNTAAPSSNRDHAPPPPPRLSNADLASSKPPASSAPPPPGFYSEVAEMLAAPPPSTGSAAPLPDRSTATPPTGPAPNAGPPTTRQTPPISSAAPPSPYEQTPDHPTAPPPAAPPATGQARPLPPTPPSQDDH